MKPSEALLSKRDRILRTLRKYPVSNPRVFGSVVYGTDTEASDLDLLVDVEKKRVVEISNVTRSLAEELSQLLKVAVDVVDASFLGAEFRNEVVETAQSLIDFRVIDLKEKFCRMNEKRLLFYLRKMEGYATETREEVVDIGSEAALLANARAQRSLGKLVEDFGENCSKVVNKFQKFATQEKNFPWDEIKNFRNILVHHYYVVAPEKIWEVATQDIPRWQKHLAPLI